MVGVGLPGAGRPSRRAEGREDRAAELCALDRGPAHPYPENLDSQALSDALQDQRLPLQGHQVAAGIGGKEQAWLPVDHAVGCEEQGLGDSGHPGEPLGSRFPRLLKGGPHSALATQEGV